ncbi:MULTISPECIES: DUF7269 family protein [Saliphagus]|uniref:DUF4129 domain-containing protein n=1 Tax=Saliphagus infecundisoli TaxID=1849069 RepID=A0ABD5QD25_9EURY|nr:MULTISPECIES: hypothetical protein [Saliphagus]
MTRTTIRLGAVTVAGLLLLAAGIFVATRPDTVTDEFPALVAVGKRVDPGRALLALIGTLTVLVPLLVAVGRYRAESAAPLGRSAVPADEADGEHPGDREGERPVVGGGLEVAVRRATDYEARGGAARSAARETVVERLRPVAADAYARREGIGEAGAREAVERGEWTDEPRAAAFLGEPSLPLSVWLYDLFTAEDPYRRSLRATVEAIEAVQTEPAAFGVPEPEPSSRPDREDADGEGVSAW